MRWVDAFLDLLRYAQPRPTPDPTPAVRFVNWRRESAARAVIDVRAADAATDAGAAAAAAVLRTAVARTKPSLTQLSFADEPPINTDGDRSDKHKHTRPSRAASA